MCPLACGGTYSAQQTLSHVNRVGSGGTYWPWDALALRKGKPVKKANVVTGFPLTLPPLPSLGFCG